MKIIQHKSVAYQKIDIPFNRFASLRASFRAPNASPMVAPGLITSFVEGADALGAFFRIVCFSEILTHFSNCYIYKYDAIE